MAGEARAREAAGSGRAIAIGRAGKLLLAEGSADRAARVVVQGRFAHLAEHPLHDAVAAGAFLKEAQARTAVEVPGVAVVALFLTPPHPVPAGSDARRSATAAAAKAGCAGCIDLTRQTIVGPAGLGDARRADAAIARRRARRTDADQAFAAIALRIEHARAVVLRHATPGKTVCSRRAAAALPANGKDELAAAALRTAGHQRRLALLAEHALHDAVAADAALKQASRAAAVEVVAVAIVAFLGRRQDGIAAQRFPSRTADFAGEGATDHAWRRADVARRRTGDATRYIP